MASSAVCSADPVFWYSHRVRAKPVMALPSWERDWVAHRIRKVFSSEMVCFIVFAP